MGRDERAAAGPRVLVVDDEVDLVALLVTILTRMGARTEGFSCAREASLRFQRDPSDFDVLLTDLRMPGMDGRELAKSCRALRPDLPVVLHTGSWVSPREAARFDAVLRKPASPRRIREVLDRILG